MNAKPAISFLNTDPDAVLASATSNIVAAMTGNPAYPAPNPALTTVSTALNAFTVAVAAAADGGTMHTSAKNARRAELVALLRQLASYVQTACQGDMTKLLSSGFPAQKRSRQPIGPLPAPAGVALSLGALSGQLSARFRPILGARLYTWRLSTGDSPDAWQDMGQTTAASNLFEDLTPGTVYNVQANAVGTAGPSDWSNIATQMAL